MAYLFEHLKSSSTKKNPHHCVPEIENLGAGKCESSGKGNCSNCKNGSKSKDVRKKHHKSQYHQMLSVEEKMNVLEISSPRPTSVSRSDMSFLSDEQMDDAKRKLLKSLEEPSVTLQIPWIKNSTEDVNSLTNTNKFTVRDKLFPTLLAPKTEISLFSSLNSPVYTEQTPANLIQFPLLSFDGDAMLVESSTNTNSISTSTKSKKRRSNHITIEVENDDDISIEVESSQSKSNLALKKRKLRNANSFLMSISGSS